MNPDGSLPADLKAPTNALKLNRVSDESAIPERFGEYVVARNAAGRADILGVGGFGVTVRASRARTVGDTEVRDEYAVKIVRGGVLQSAAARKLFIREILALRELQHANIVRYWDCGEEAGSVYLVMDLCRGGHLAGLVERLGPFSETLALRVILQACEGLEEAHANGYLHRDLKPANILLAQALPQDAGLGWLTENVRRARFKIVDFGLATRTGHTGEFAGSPMFACPEQIRGHELREYGDIYSLGMTLWYLVAGTGPLIGSDGRGLRSVREVMRLHSSNREHDTSFPRKWSSDFRSLLAQMVRKTPEDRFKSGWDLAAAIRKCLEHASEGTLSESAPEIVLRDLAVLDEEWQTGSFSDYYHIKEQVGRRPFGKHYRAERRATGDTVSLTAWMVGSNTADQADGLIREHLREIWAATLRSDSPSEVVRIQEVRRTAQEWCISEEWVQGPSFADLLTVRGHPPDLVEIALLLWPVARACDFLQECGIHTALLTLSDLRISREGEIGEANSWLCQPVTKWGEWTARVSALSIPEEFMEEERAGVTASREGSSSFADDLSYGMLRAFARLFYRLVNGTELPPAADWDVGWYITASRLGPASNVLLRDCVADKIEGRSPGKILGQILRNEGIYRAISTSRRPAAVTHERTSPGDATPPTVVRIHERYGRAVSEQESTESVQAQHEEISRLKREKEEAMTKVRAAEEAVLRARQEAETAVRRELIEAESARREQEEALQREAAEKERARSEAEALKKRELAKEIERQKQEESRRLEIEEERNRNWIHATKDQPFVNSLGMNFVPVAKTCVLFSIWETRVKDFAAFEKENRGLNAAWRDPHCNGEPVCPEADCPVVNVSWTDSKRFCEWLSKKEGRRYRLPTDAEWSIAVGLGQESGATPKDKDRQTPGYPWGNKWPPSGRAGNYADESARDSALARNVLTGYNDGYRTTSPVGNFPSNRFGLYDMGGNVWEWCEDLFDKLGSRRVLRGASWRNFREEHLRSSYRGYDDPGAQVSYYGFRVVIVLPGG